MTSIPPESLPERVVASLSDGVIVIDRNGEVLLMNPAAELLMNRSFSGVAGKRFPSLFPEGGELSVLIERCMESGMAVSDHRQAIAGRGGKTAFVSVTVTPLLEKDGTSGGVILLLRDITTIHELECSSRHEERLSMLGTMALGLAHEIRNPLGGIKGAAQLMREEIPPDSAFRDYLRVIVKEVERVDRLVGRLLDLGADRPPVLEPVDINRLLADVIILNRGVLAERKVSVVQTLDTSIPPFIGDPAQLDQLFLNLVKNAIEALPDGGTIFIASRIVSDYLVTQRGEKRSRMVAIEIADTGPGFPEGVIERLVTPFFTTKREGTGLGLALCQKIVSEHRGMLKFDNREEGGGVVTVILPMETRKEGGKHAA